MTTTRPNQTAWVTAFEAAPPAACATLRALSNTVEYGLTCVFAEEDGDTLPNPVNTACLPWATGSVPATSIFYSPATACPTSWSAVATRSAAEGASDWVDGETALECCPPGFVGGAGGMCNPDSRATMPVVSCGEADAEENENAVYAGGSWPASVSARVTALQLRFQPSDVGGMASATATTSGTSSTSTSGSDSGSGSGDGGLSIGAKAAIGTVIPLVFILGALAALLLWRRRKHSKNAAALAKHSMDENETKHSFDGTPQQNVMSAKGVPVAGVAGAPAAAAVAATVVPTRNGAHETPEWNAELDATEAERRRYMAVQGSLFPPVSSAAATASNPGGASEASELGGMMRVNRKPVAPVELDSMPVTAELNGDEGERR